MSTEAPENAGGAKGETKPCKTERKCPVENQHIHGNDMKTIWKECQDESFWYRALPLSLGSMAVTGGLIYKGIWKQSKRFGPFPKLALAGILGYAVGKVSYFPKCASKFQNLGPEFYQGQGWGSGGPGYGPPWAGGQGGPAGGQGGPGYGPPWAGGQGGSWYGPPWAGGQGHRHCGHVCQECKKLEKQEAGQANATPAQS